MAERPPSALYRDGVPVPVNRRFVHVDGTECVAGYVGETMECGSGHGVVVRMDAYLALKAQQRVDDGTMSIVTTHEFRQTVFGKDAAEVYDRAKAAVHAYFGAAAEGVEWSVESEARLNMGGKVISYEGQVRARRT